MDNHCKLCHSDEEPDHKASLLHRFNFALLEWNEYRKPLVKNRHGVEIHVALCDVVKGNEFIYIEQKNGCHETKITSDQTRVQSNRISYLFTVKNIQSSTVLLLSAKLLYPYAYFKLIDFESELKSDHVLELTPGAEYCFKVTFQPDDVTIGSYSIPVAISLQTEKAGDFTIAREMLVTISDEDFSWTDGSTGKSPFTNSIWENVDVWHAPTINSYLNCMYPIPPKFAKTIKMGIDIYPNMTSAEIVLLNELKFLMKPGYVTKNNYNDFFHIALWADEISQELMLRRYNMEKVKVKVIINKDEKILELDVPGLAEKRPSLVNGDIVNIRIHADHQAYKGVIRSVNNSNIWIHGIDELIEVIDTDTELDVSFQLGRLPIERMHTAVDKCFSSGIVDYLFPDEILLNKVLITERIRNEDFYNRNICTNIEQRIAVEKIVQNKYGIVPYIVFGPPGTGKTITIVEAILQIVRNCKDRKVILVCAPANAACDMLTSKLIEHGLSKNELIRVHSDTRDWKSIPADVQEYSNYAEDTYTKPSGDDLMKYRVIVTTLILSGRYKDRRFSPDVLFIDEAAQAMEPEADVAISLLNYGKQLILAGDPKQLGPQCNSKVAENLGLDVSLLERLMKLPLYSSHNSNFISTLKNNFRAHPLVLQLPNELFYDNQLKAVSKKAKVDEISQIFVHDVVINRKSKKKNSGLPIEFCAVFAQEQREGESPSFFNEKEIQMVSKYVKALIKLHVDPSDIGIVTPYIRQVHRIKQALANEDGQFGKVEVGTTEVFQGREKRVIIISTVRAQHNLLLHDSKYKLGFIKNEKRFNVALTRAMSKLIIIGCPNVLRYDRNWLKYIELCETRNAYFGAKRDKRTDELKLEDNECKLCNSHLDPNHKNSLLHRFNFSLFEWNCYRKPLVKDRHGVEVHVALCDLVNGINLTYVEYPNIGCHETKLSVNQLVVQHNSVSYLFTVANKQNHVVNMVAAKLIHPYPYFRLYDIEGNLMHGAALELQPIAVDLKTSKGEDFTIAREMLITIGDEAFNLMNQSSAKSPFTSAIWKDVSTWHPPTTNSFTNYIYPISPRFSKIIKMGIDIYNSITSEDMVVLQEIKELIDPGYVTRDNYSDFFHIALWADEMGTELMLRRYNMEQVTMKILKRNLLELDVPGLAEKRPSLVKGDVVNIRIHNDHQAYKGVIRAVNNLNIWIEGVQSDFIEVLDEDTELDVSYQLGRLPLERMHSAVDRCVSNGLLDYLFPDVSLANRRMPVQRIPNVEFFNGNVCHNVEQRIAVETISQIKYCNAPYIVFGPPGTGKTITIVEAILQIVRNRTGVVLVCAPANAACDMLTSKLIEHLSVNQLIRVHSETRDWKVKVLSNLSMYNFFILNRDSIPENVQRYSNYVDGSYTKPDGRELMKYRVVVTTLILSGRYKDKGFAPNVLFIDEAAQAMEPEADVAISLLKPGKLLVLAGDPKQLGPQCDSAVAERLGLNISLLERLMRLPLYSNNDTNYISTLKRNFRAHQVVLQLPNDLFYESQLQAVSEKANNDPIATVFVYDKIFGRKRKGKHFGEPVEFCAVFAKEQRQGRSPSYFNVKEVEMVFKYVKALISLEETKVVPSDIGVVTPYIRQVYRIKDALTREKLDEVEVGTTEVFQGREKRIIIISTVRAQHNLLLYDRKYKLGFVKNEKRFNVALTRAMSKLIIIGCPNVLRYDKNWLKYIEYCEDRGAYFGARQDKRTDQDKMYVLDKLSNIKRDKQFVRNHT
ncbi:hypothetical protein FQR65_LT05514 [Abscondita terminalis]|nr:hypothetical protein FQR65_LT05514 [Abscondita terminalis]